jgi:flagellar protein FliS
MIPNPYLKHVDEQILSTDPVGLVQLLYRRLNEKISEARRAVRANDIQSRSLAVSAAVEILGELSHSLDFEAGGEIAARLAALYEYMVHRLIEANFHQADGPLAEVQSLVETLLEAWSGIRLTTEAPEPPDARAGEECAFNYVG